MFGILPFALFLRVHLGTPKRPFSNKQFVGDEIPQIQMHQPNWGETKTDCYREPVKLRLDSFSPPPLPDIQVRDGSTDKGLQKTCDSEVERKRDDRRRGT